MDTVKFSAKNIGNESLWNNEVCGYGTARNTRIGGRTDLENEDCVLKVRKANENAGPFGNLIINNPARVYREYDYFEVIQPGFYFYRNLRKKTKTFDVILFMKTGFFYSEEIYRRVDYYGQNYSTYGIFGEHELLTGDDFEKSSLKSCIPIGCGNDTNTLMNSDFGKNLFKELLTAITGEEQEAEEEPEEFEIDNDACIFNGCRVIFSTIDSLVTLKSDCSFEDFRFPNSPANDTSGIIYHRLYNLSARRGARLKFRHWDRYRYNLEYYFYNDETNEIVWDDATNDEFAAFCLGRNKLIMTGLKDYVENNKKDKTLTKGVRKLIKLSGPTSFKERINKHFKKNGLINHEVVDVWPALICGQWTHYDFNAEAHNNNQTLDEGYYLVVNYKGKEIIGPNSKNTFTFLCVKEEKKNNRIRLIHSSRCQHVTAWSGGTTDQQYDHWNITDWLTGPMAEEAKIEMEEFPAIFMGNKITKNRKKEALNALRDRLNRINAQR